MRTVCETKNLYKQNRWAAFMMGFNNPAAAAAPNACACVVFFLCYEHDPFDE